MELADRIMAEIRKRGEENIYRFRLKGMRDPRFGSAMIALSSLRGKQRLVISLIFKQLTVRIRAHTCYDTSKPYCQNFIKTIF